MYFDDFIAQQTIRANAPSAARRPHAPQPTRGVLRRLWSGLRHAAWGIDAGSAVRHGIAVPPDHGARNHGG